MEYTILAFIALIFYGMTFALCVMILDQYKKAKIAKHLAEAQERHKIDLQRQTAIDFIKNNLLDVDYSRFTLQNYEYMIDWLSEHLLKYPDGKIPALSGSIIYTSEHSKYTMTFFDGNDKRVERYIKTCFKLLKEKRVKINVLAEANKVIRSKRIKKEIVSV